MSLLRIDLGSNCNAWIGTSLTNFANKLGKHVIACLIHKAYLKGSKATAKQTRGEKASIENILNTIAVDENGHIKPSCDVLISLIYYMDMRDFELDTQMKMNSCPDEAPSSVLSKGNSKPSVP